MTDKNQNITKPTSQAQKPPRFARLLDAKGRTIAYLSAGISLDEIKQLLDGGFIIAKI